MDKPRWRCPEHGHHPSDTNSCVLPTTLQLHPSSSSSRLHPTTSAASLVVPPRMRSFPPLTTPWPRVGPYLLGSRQSCLLQLVVAVLGISADGHPCRRQESEEKSGPPDGWSHGGTCQAGGEAQLISKRWSLSSWGCVAPSALLGGGWRRRGHPLLWTEVTSPSRGCPHHSTCSSRSSDLGEAVSLYPPQHGPLETPQLHPPALGDDTP